MSVVGDLVDSTALDAEMGLVCVACGARHQYDRQTRMFFLPPGWGVYSDVHDTERNGRAICPGHREVPRPVVLKGGRR